MPSVKVKNRQTLLDIAILESGNVDAALEMAVANGLSITEDLASGSYVQLVAVKDAAVVNELVARGARAVSADEVSGDVIVKMEGISFWSIAIDFKVS